MTLEYVGIITSFIAINEDVRQKLRNLKTPAFVNVYGQIMENVIPL